MSKIVEQGIARDLLHGSVMAWKFLAANKVPDDVILRVLADPGKRRESDQFAASKNGFPDLDSLANTNLPLSN